MQNCSNAHMPYAGGMKLDRRPPLSRGDVIVLIKATVSSISSIRAVPSWDVHFACSRCIYGPLIPTHILAFTDFAETLKLTMAEGQPPAGAPVNHSPG